MQLPRFVCSGTMVIELREFNDKKKKKKNNMDKMQKLNIFIIKPKSGNLMKYLVHRLFLTYSVLIKSQIDLKLKAKSEFPNVWGEYKNHSNPYIQGTTVPCDIYIYVVLRGWIKSAARYYISDI